MLFSALRCHTKREAKSLKVHFLDRSKEAEKHVMITRELDNFETTWHRTQDQEGEWQGRHELL